MSKLRDKALNVLNRALESENWREQLTAARIVLAKLDDDILNEGLDVYEAAMQHYEKQQRKRRAPNGEDDEE